MVFHFWICHTITIFLLSDFSSFLEFCCCRQSPSEHFCTHFSSTWAGVWRTPELWYCWVREYVHLKKYNRMEVPVFFPSHNIQVPYLSIVSHYFYQCFQYPPIWWMKMLFCFILHFWLLVILNIFLDFIDHLYSFFCELPTHFLFISMHFLFAIDLWALLYSDIKHLLTMLNIFLLSNSLLCL